MENIVYDDKIFTDDDTLDTSWIDFQYKMENIHEHYIQEPMTDINIFCLYVNSESNIDYVISEKESLTTLSNGKTGISKDRLLQIIQKKKMHYHDRAKKCKLIDILYFNASIESADIEDDYMNQSNNHLYSSYFKTLPIFNEITIDDSIFVFHDVNSIFFVFKEIISHNTSLKSILKSNDHNSSSAKSTKKVHIDTSLNKEFMNKSMKLKHRRKMTRRK